MSDGKSALAGASEPAQSRRSIEAEALKAFVHPLRLAMYSSLQTQGPATASQLARELGESSGQTSYHLRQLERHGLVEDDPEHAGGRERWWRTVGFALDSVDLFLDPVTAIPARTVLHQSIAERTNALTAWANHLDLSDPEWSGLLTSATEVMSQDEYDGLVADIHELIEARLTPLRERPASQRPAGARRVRIHLDVLPLPTRSDDDGGLT